MNEKRNTPRQKIPPKFSKSPSSLSATISSGSGSTSKIVRKGTPKIRNFESSANTTTSSVNPKIKTNLATSYATAVDYELECDFAYNEYLQALIKKEIVSEIIETHEQDIKDQLQIYKDSLHKMKQSYKKLEQQVTQLEKLSKVDDIVKNLDDIVTKFQQLCDDSELERNLQNLLNVLNLASNKLALKNIRPIIFQGEYDKLMKLIELCADSTERIKSSGRDIENVTKLAECLRALTELKETLDKKQKQLSQLQKEASYTLFKNISDLFVKKENYNEK